ncbi:glycoside hydrolase family 6 protein [Kitasatospora sp. LaBMicrA B282]|uniref:glycoside hydrolase family 6 protein n=1 Tax=Kitasatospora sp. LaBMicrA B282 TaxID=3420949 RepID=UPI003D123211
MRRRARVAALVAAALAVAAAGCGGTSPAPPTAEPFFVWDQSSAAQQLAQAQAQGRADELPALHRIADQPMGIWLTGPDPAAVVRPVLARAAAAHQVPLLVAYDIPRRDCGRFSAGGAGDAAGYRAWIDELAGALAGHQAWVVLEPDAVANTLADCGLDQSAVGERYGVLAYAVGQLKRQPGVRVYLDAGNPGWLTDQDALAAALRSAGLAQADGFAVNVANFYRTDDSAHYGAALSAALGGKHFVIDTSRNGNGPLSATAWCNPAGRALGPAPTTRTGDPLVDAYLWVKNPGESDGDCGRGEPKAGDFWLAYALALAK